MKVSPFHRGGPVPPESKVYIQRRADTDALVCLRNMDYLLMFEPRQQGKSSIIWRVSHILQQENFIIVCLQMSDLLGHKDREEWFSALYQMICDDLKDTVSSKQLKSKIPTPDSNTNWPSFLRMLAEFAYSEKLKMILVFDEAGAISSAWATPFFSAIRSVYHRRLAHPRYGHLTFIVSGTFNPWTLISDPEISDFNTAHQILLDDFSLDNIKYLVGLLDLGDQENLIAEKIFEWTSGQPFLVQLICDDLATYNGNINGGTVDEIVKQIIATDTQHIQGIFRHLKNNPDLIDELNNLLENKIKLAINLSDKHFQLVKNIGLLSLASPVKVRNKIYRERLDTFLYQNSIIKDEKNTMDPIQLVVTALISGLVSGMTDSAKSIAKDAFESFKKRLSQKVKGHEDAVNALHQLEKQPESVARKDLLSEELSKIGFSENEDKDLMNLAQSFLEKVDKEGAQSGKYVINIQNVQGITIGDQNTVEQIFKNRSEKG